jgi:hypothetical protein
MVPDVRRVRLALALALLAGCGASGAELRVARTSGYRADFAIVYGAALEAVRAKYPKLVEDARAGTIKTAWHPVMIPSQNQADPSQSPAGGIGAAGGTTGGANLTKSNVIGTTFFIRVSVAVVGGDPWRVRIDGEASRWNAGDVPVPLRDADRPPWLDARIEALVVDVHERLERYAEPLPMTSTRDPAPAKVADPRWAALPAGVGDVLAALERAAAARDVGALAAHLDAAVVWSPGSPGSSDVALATWRADPSILAGLGRAIGDGCASGAGGVVCPAAGAAPEYRGPRARLERRGGTWRLVELVVVE